MLRRGENLLYFPESHPRTDISALAHLKCRPGEYIAVMDPPRDKTAGGVHLMTRGDGWGDIHTLGTDRAEANFEAACKELEVLREALKLDPLSWTLKKRVATQHEIAMAALATAEEYAEQQNPGAALDLRSDVCTVAAVGEGIPFVPGDRVMIAPYSAWRIKHMLGVDDVVIMGVDDPWQEVTPLIYNPTHNVWEPLDNWLIMAIQEKGIDLETAEAFYDYMGRIKRAGPLAESKIGDLVVLNKDIDEQRPDDTKWFGVRMSPWPRGTAVVRETDATGVRRVLGTIQEVR